MAKIKSKGLFCCDTFILDKSNKASLIGIFENINLDSFPGKMLKIVLVSMFEFEFAKDEEGEEKIKVDVKLFDPKDEQVSINVPTLEMVLRPSSPSAALALELGNIEFKSEGRHLFKLYVSGKEFNSIGVNVNRKK